jgi:23S rRNA A2030 N6-methylase RlmJ
MNDREFAIAEANNNNESSKYFEARPHLNNDVSQRVYTAAFYSGFEACMRTLMKEQAATHAIELRAYEATVDNLVQALRGVIRVADRDTDEFDAAKAAILNAVGE